MLYFSHMNILTYRTIIEKDGKGYHGYVPALPGCHTYGETVEETRSNLKEAIEGILLVMKEHNDPIPSENERIETTETIDMQKLFSSGVYA